MSAGARPPRRAALRPTLVVLGALSLVTGGLVPALGASHAPPPDDALAARAVDPDVAALPAELRARLGLDDALRPAAAAPPAAARGDGTRAGRGPVELAGATEVVPLPGARDVAWAPDGSLVALTWNGVRRVAADGTVSTLVRSQALTGRTPTDGATAAETVLPVVTAVEAAADGALYLALVDLHELTGSQVWRLDPAGERLTRVWAEPSELVLSVSVAHGRLLLHHVRPHDPTTSRVTWVDPASGAQQSAAAPPDGTWPWEPVTDSGVERPPTAQAGTVAFAVPADAGEAWLVGTDRDGRAVVRLTSCGLDRTVTALDGPPVVGAWPLPDGGLLLARADGTATRVGLDGVPGDAPSGVATSFLLGLSVNAAGDVARVDPSARAVAVHRAAVSPAPVTRASGCSLGELHAVPPARALDTRDGTGAPRGAVPAGADVVLDLAGRAGLPPQGVDAVALVVTATGAGTNGYVSVRPGDATGHPTTSNLNVAAGRTRSVTVTSRVDADGRVRLTNGTAAPLHLVADVSGWFADGTDDLQRGALLHPVAALDGEDPRVLDTRRRGSGGALHPWSPRRVQVTGRAGVPADGVTAVSVNVTAVSPEASGHLTVWGGGAAPPTSALNVDRGRTVANHVVVPVAADGTIGLLSPVGMHVLVDVQGWYAPDAAEVARSGRVVTQTPRRVLDTRVGDPLGARVLQAGTSAVTVPVAGRGGVPTRGATAVVLSVAAVGATQPTYLTVWPGGGPRPEASAVNVDPGGDVANLVVAPLGADGTVTVDNQAGSTHLLVDVLGWVTG
ncbi:hypothetical protein [Thalassiella azotivora]